jgi:ArsR family transcriptional regulator
LQIVELLRDGEECVCELTDKVGAAQSRLSFHLKTLKDAGLLKDRRDGRWIYYSLDADLLEEMTETLGAVKARAAKASACCD